MILHNKRILLGITGGIAAYKSAWLIRLLKQAGADVRCVMTEGAKAFITPLTCQALSGHPVRSELFDCAAEHGMGHIELAKWADCLVIAPATANVIAKLAHGYADDLLSTLYLATRVPVVIAPAMNQAMWSHEATQANIALISMPRIHWCGPIAGEQACGDKGLGCMASPDTIVDAVIDCLRHSSLNLSCTMVDGKQSTEALNGLKILMTAGPTQEAIDPVRYISNRSSGKMGFALAGSLAELGAEVTLVAGPVHLPSPSGVRRINVRTASEMASVVFELANENAMYIGAAAIADFTVKHAKQQKIKKSAFTQELVLLPTVDIIQSLAQEKPHLFLVGFAAETQKVEAYAQAKLNNKGLDLIVANKVGEDLGFEQDDNAVIIYSHDEEPCSFGPMPKQNLAQYIVRMIAKKYCQKVDFPS